MAKTNAKALLYGALFGRWRRPRPLRDGYTILMPMPTDMPFLLRFALEGVRAMETPNCRQVVVIPDGWGADGGREFEAIIAACGDPRVELTRVPRHVSLFIHKVQKRRSNQTAANWSHWAMIVEGTSCASAAYAFLHDADAFFIDADGLERQYREARDRGMYTLGVQYRVDEFYAKVGRRLPGTWEMMFSVPWARRHSPYLMKGQWRDTPLGRKEFDTMLYPQFLDAPSGKVGVMDDPPRLVHFHGTITTYRVYRDRPGTSVVDTAFRLLLLSILEDLLPAPDGKRLLPPPSELARGLTDPTAPVTYGGRQTSKEYPGFRRSVNELRQAPTFQGERADRIRAMLLPFDEHFAGWETAAVVGDEDARVLLPEAESRHTLG